MDIMYVQMDLSILNYGLLSEMLQTTEFKVVECKNVKISNILSPALVPYAYSKQIKLIPKAPSSSP